MLFPLPLVLAGELKFKSRKHFARCSKFTIRLSFSKSPRISWNWLFWMTGHSSISITFSLSQRLICNLVESTVPKTWISFYRMCEFLAFLPRSSDLTNSTRLFKKTVDPSWSDLIMYTGLALSRILYWKTTPSLSISLNLQTSSQDGFSVLIDDWCRDDCEMLLKFDSELDGDIWRFWICRCNWAACFRR